MEKYYSGSDGSLLLNGRRVAKVRGWSLRGQVGALPVTSLGDDAEDFTSGIKSGSGSCTVWYYNDAPVEILDKVFRTTAANDDSKVQLQLTWGTKLIRALVLFTEASLQSAVGDVMAADCQFTVCSDLLEVNL